MIRRWALRVVGASILLAIYAAGYAICLRFLRPEMRAAIRLDEGWRIVAMDPGLRFITTAKEEAVRIHDVDAGRELSLYFPHGDEIWCAGAAWYRHDPERKMLTRFDPRTGAGTASVGVDFGPPVRWNWLIAHPSGDVLFGEASGGVTCWDPDSGRKRTMFPGEPLTAISVSQTGKYVELRRDERGKGPPNPPRTTTKSGGTLLLEDATPGSVTLLGDFKSARILGEMKKADGSPSVFSADETHVAISAPLRAGDLSHRQQFEFLEVPSLRPVRRIEGSHLVAFESAEKVRIVGRNGTQHWRLGSEKPESVATMSIDSRPIPYQTSARTLTISSISGPGRTHVLIADAIEFLRLPAAAERIRTWLRGTPLNRFEVMLIRLESADDRAPDEMERARRRDPANFRVFQSYLDGDGTRIGLGFDGALEIYDRPFRKRWGAIYAYPLVGVAAVLAAWWTLRAGWRILRRTTSTEAAA
jgi:hypothetical protein